MNSCLHKDNRANFKAILHDQILQKYRQSIFDHMIRCEESEFFDIDKFRISNTIEATDHDDMMSKIIIIIRDELQQQLGWKTELSYGGTALFIYSDTRPRNCWVTDDL